MIEVCLIERLNDSTFTNRSTKNERPLLAFHKARLPEGILPAGGDPVVQLLRAGHLLLPVRPGPVERFLNYIFLNLTSLIMRLEFKISILYNR